MSHDLYQIKPQHLKDEINVDIQKKLDKIKANYNNSL